MPVSESKKKSNRKWDDENMAALACRVRKEEADKYRELAKSQGKSIHAVIRNLLQEWSENA